MTDNLRSTITTYITRHPKEVRVAGFLLAFMLIWTQAAHIREFLDGLFDGAAGL
jgi:hypothetical protein